MSRARPPVRSSSRRTAARTAVTVAVTALAAGLLAAPATAADPGSTTTGGMGQGSPDAPLGPSAFADASSPNGVPTTPFDPDYDRLAPGTTDITDNLRFVTNVPNPAGFEGSISSNLAFDGDTVYQGSYNGLKIYDVSDPESPQLQSSLLCPGGQGDLSLAGDLLFFSVDLPRSDNTCGSTAVSSATAGNWEGIRVFDVSDPTDPQYVSEVETRCGSHTHTLIDDGSTSGTAVLYNSAYDVSDTAETCTRPHNQVELIEVPLDAPEEAAETDQLMFWDEENPPFALSDRVDGGAATSVTNGCHDLTAYPDKGLLAAACMGDGLLVDITDPAEPVVVDRVRDENFAFWHTAQFNNDATKLIYQDELGGGGQATCSPNTPQYRGADGLYDIEGSEIVLKSYFKIPRRQGVSATTAENCVGHEGNIVEVEGRDILVQAWYRGGVSLIDFTDSTNPVEIGYFDRGPGTGTPTLGGTWAAYAHNGYIWSSEIAEGLDVLQLQGDEFEDSLRYRMDRRNPATQTELSWPWKVAPVLPADLSTLPRIGAVPFRAETGSGTTVALTAEGGTFEPGEWVDVWSSANRPRKLATGQADDTGGISLDVDLPDSYAGGPRYFVLRGDDDLDQLYASRVQVAKARPTVRVQVRPKVAPVGTRVTATVRVLSSPAALGRVTVRFAGAVLPARLRDGVATVRLPAVKRATTFTVRARYPGSPRVAAGSAQGEVRFTR